MRPPDCSMVTVRPESFEYLRAPVGRAGGIRFVSEQCTSIYAFVGA